MRINDIQPHPLTLGDFPARPKASDIASTSTVSIRLSSNPPLLSKQLERAASFNAPQHQPLKLPERHQELFDNYRLDLMERGSADMPRIDGALPRLLGGMLEANPGARFDDVAAYLPGISPPPRLTDPSVADRLNEIAARSEPHSPPDVRETAQIFAEYVGKLGDYLEHAHLLHDTALREQNLSQMDRADVRRSQTALASAAREAIKSVPDALETSLNKVKANLALLEYELTETAPSDDRIKTIQTEMKAHEQTLAFLQGVQTDYQGHSKVKHLATIQAHLNLEDVQERLSKPLKSTEKGKVIMGSAIVQGVQTFLHLGEVRSWMNVAASTQITRNDAPGYLGRAAMAGSVTGFAHEAIGGLMKPILENGLQALGVPGLKPVKADTIVPKPLRSAVGEYGEVVKKSAHSLTEETTQADRERLRVSNKQLRSDTVLALGDSMAFIPRSAVQVLRQSLNDAGVADLKTPHILSGFGALGSGTAGAIKSVVQLHTSYTDPQGRKFAIFEPQKTPQTSIGDKIKQSLDIRQDKVRSNFYSKMASAVQGSLLGDLTPKTNSSTSLSSGQRATNALLGMSSPITYLSSIYSNQAVSTEIKARKGKIEPGDRLANAAFNIAAQHRTQLPRATGADSHLRPLENTYHTLRGMLQVAPQAATEMMSLLDRGVTEGVRRVAAAITDDKATSNETTGDDPPASSASTGEGAPRP
ncbi:hypothetical protein JMY81_12950 [Brenneria goodwinii]|uniref:hypothetical protein n=1 Tax=Brenneria goodwinii TaxID=1109412 RepID=UPI000EF17AFC|nr:hypothetical protein [Brenneria goodwinii]MCG8157777.1 hypothetical protein [Brenneria goodwinii]MCG8161724.1 hypothetical protein [Brenneria goodwinii]MCG8166642.1 hypothetical protein [Brenneria goodwinii]MCG8171400.1 hypothetical protein [Brenneria goodwinii]MCG8175393.1 hypothetical protein [Brenneria goodwinii]